MTKKQTRRCHEEDDIFMYLSYVTLREGWDQVKGFFGPWLILTVFCLAIQFLIDFSVSTTEPVWSIIPKPLLYVVAFAAFTWFLRGEEFKVVFPKSFKLQLLVTLYVAFCVLAGTMLPTWAILPVILAAMLGIVTLATLAEVGKKNFQKLSGPPSNSS